MLVFASLSMLSLTQYAQKSRSHFPSRSTSLIHLHCTCAHFSQRPEAFPLGVELQVKSVLGSQLNSSKDFWNNLFVKPHERDISIWF